MFKHKSGSISAATRLTRSSAPGTASLKNLMTIHAIAATLTMKMVPMWTSRLYLTKSQPNAPKCAQITLCPARSQLASGMTIKVANYLRMCKQVAIKKASFRRMTPKCLLKTKNSCKTTIGASRNSSISKPSSRKTVCELKLNQWLQMGVPTLL